MSNRPSSRRPNATPVFESGRLERTYSGSGGSGANLKIVKEEIDHQSGNKVQLVRTIPEETESSDEVVDKLFRQYTYRNGLVQAKKEDLEAFKKAFPTHGEKIIETYEGSNIVTDNSQELIGEKYYSRQIDDIKRKNKISFLEKWDHLLYQGDDNYKPSIATPLPHINFSTAPTQSRTFSINSSKPTQSRTFSINSNRK